MKMKIEFLDNDAEKYYLALKPEIESVPYKKTHTSIFLEEGKVVITIEGKELNSIRGTFNSYLNWLKIIDDNIRL
ncbi:MAG: KEOPS complex subunit Pcc1 [Candidatus Methanofastidiosia archaeon]